jgi:hypothetical protein
MRRIEPISMDAATGKARELLDDPCEQAVLFPDRSEAPVTSVESSGQEGSTSEERIVEVVDGALAAAGIEDTVIAAGEFYPRGHTGAGFAGSLIGGDIGDALGPPAGGIGVAGGYLAGTHAHDAGTGMPDRMVVGVSETTIYGFAGSRVHPKALAFRVPREGLETKVHQRVNVRVLQLNRRAAPYSLGRSTARSEGPVADVGSSSSADSASLSNRASASSHDATAAAASSPPGASK